MTTNSVYNELYRVKALLTQIEIYTDRKRRWNRIGSIVIVICAPITALLAYFSENSCYRWAAIISACIVALITIAKDYLKIIMQPESEIFELDDLHSFYNDYLIKLERLYELRFLKESDINDLKMNDKFYELRLTEGNRMQRVNILCRRFSKEEKKRIEELTVNHYKTKYCINNEQQTK